MRMERKVVVERFVIDLEDTERALLASVLRHLVDTSALRSSFRAEHVEKVKRMLAVLEAVPPA